jgi:hypothetical protein
LGHLVVREQGARLPEDAARRVVVPDQRAHAGVLIGPPLRWPRRRGGQAWPERRP